MNKRQQQLFIYFFDEICEAQQVFDQLKIDLLNRPGFNPHILFELISEDSQQISVRQMRTYLSQKIACTPRELYQIFRKFDHKKNGFISRQDFVSELTPLNQKQLRQSKQGTVNIQIQNSFLELIIEILKRFRIIQEARKQIAFIQPWQAFSHIDEWNKGTIGLEDLQKFYNDNDFQIKQFNLRFMLHALGRRYHRDVTLQLFCECLNPLQLGEYSKYTQAIQNQNHQQFLKRSRRQQSQIKQQRIGNKLLQYELQRAQRRKKAEIQRQVNLGSAIDQQLLNYDKKQEEFIRKALLQQEKNIRDRTLLENSVHRDNFKNSEDARRVRELEELKQRQRQMNETLARQIASREAELGTSKRRTAYDNEMAIRQQIQREKQAKRLLSRSIQEQMSRSRQRNETNYVRERQVFSKQIEKERQLRSPYPETSPSSYDKQKLIRGYQPQSSQMSNSIKQSRIQELQHELEKTRAEMRERRERLQLQDKMRSLQTASQSKVSAFQY